MEGAYKGKNLKVAVSDISGGGLVTRSCPTPGRVPGIIARQAPLSMGFSW